MGKYKEHLAHLRATDWWRDLIDHELTPLAPDVPAYSHGKTEAEWVYGTGLRDGYLLCLKHLGVELE